MGDMGCLVDPAARLPGGGADIPQGCQGVTEITR